MAEGSSTPAQARPVPIAPALDSNADSQDTNEEHMSYACVTCTRRKVKCDKLSPTCSTCKRAKLECEYQEPAPRKRKRKPPADENVMERLERYESLLKQHGIAPGEAAKSPAGKSPSYPSPMNSQKGPVNDGGPGKLLGDHGKTRYIDSNLWSNLGEHDLHPSSDEEDDEPENEPMSGILSTPGTDPVSAALLGTPSTPANLLSFHPTYEHAMKLWKIYSDYVDPIVKVVHVPSGLKMVQRAASNPSSISKATEALLFAIYHFSARVIPDKDCQLLFGVDKVKLAALYHDAVRQALVHASFLRTTDIQLLQALILFLMAVRSTYDPHTFWILTGVAVRIGQRMGLHRDGNELGLNPFVTQMRRRIFWQLLPLDGMASQISGTGVHSANQYFWTTEQPSNYNDSDIWPDMTETPKERIGATDIIFVRARTEMMKFIQDSNPPLPIFGPTTQSFDFKHTAEWQRQLDELESRLEAQYLRYCDFANPLHNIVAAMGRTATNSGRLRIQLARAKAVGDITEEEREELWTLSEKILDYSIACQQNLNLERFFWHLEAFFQWDPLIWILNEILRSPGSHGHDGIWDKIEKVYTTHPKMQTQRRALNIGVGQIVLRAWDAEHPTRSQDQQTMQMEPAFITSLRTFTSKRGNSRGGSAVPANLDYNPFDPTQEAWEELGTFKYPANATWNSNMYDFNNDGYSGDVRTNTLHWMFWDQLARDPNTYSAPSI